MSKLERYYQQRGYSPEQAHKLASRGKAAKPHLQRMEERLARTMKGAARYTEYIRLTGTAGSPKEATTAHASNGRAVRTARVTKTELTYLAAVKVAAKGRIT